MKKNLPVAAAQQVIDLLIDGGYSYRDIHRQTKLALQTLNSIKLGRYPNVKAANYERLVAMLGYYPDVVRETVEIAVPVGKVIEYLHSTDGRRFVDKCRDGVNAA